MKQQSSTRDFDRQPRNGTVGHKYKQASQRERGTAGHEAGEEEEEEGQECMPGDRSSGDRRRRRPASGGRPCGSGMPVESFTHGRWTQHGTAQDAAPPKKRISQATGPFVQTGTRRGRYATTPPSEFPPPCWRRWRKWRFCRYETWVS
jgi:hypothetical protein